MESESVVVRASLDASVERVWPLLRDFFQMDAWSHGATIEKTEGIGCEVGAVRHVRTAEGLFVERCTGLDHENHALRYEVVRSPWQLLEYVADVRVTAIDDGRCRIEWACRFVPSRLTRPSKREEIERMYAYFLKRLARTLAA